MEKEIEKAIRETLVISNPQSINIAVKKILLLFDVSGCVCDEEDKHEIVKIIRGKTLGTWKKYAEDEYHYTPMQVVTYITILEKEITKLSIKNEVAVCENDCDGVPKYCEKCYEIESQFRQCY
jgi:hypothetical protein